MRPALHGRRSLWRQPRRSPEPARSTSGRRGRRFKSGHPRIRKGAIQGRSSGSGGPALIIPHRRTAGLGQRLAWGEYRAGYRSRRDCLATATVPTAPARMTSGSPVPMLAAAMGESSSEIFVCTSISSHTLKMRTPRPHSAADTDRIAPGCGRCRRITAQAATTAGVALLYSLDTASAGAATAAIFKKT